MCRGSSWLSSSAVHHTRCRRLRHLAVHRPLPDLGRFHACCCCSRQVAGHGGVVFTHRLVSRRPPRPLPPPTAPGPQLPCAWPPRACLPRTMFRVVCCALRSHVRRCQRLDCMVQSGVADSWGPVRRPRRPKRVAVRTRRRDDDQVAGAIGGTPSLLRGTAHRGEVWASGAALLVRSAGTRATRTSSSSDSACCFTSVNVSCLAGQEEGSAASGESGR